MPAKTKKPAVKKPAAKPASKPLPKASVVKSKSKPAVKKPAPKKVAATKPSPKKTAPKKPAPKKPAPKKPSPKPVKKSSPKKAPAKPAPAKKPAAKAVKPAAPAKKPAKAAKPAAPAKPAKPAKASAPAPAPAPVVATPEKTAKEPKKAKTSSKSAPAPITVKGRATFTNKGTPRTGNDYEDEGITIEPQKGPVKMTTFLKKQRQRLVDLRDAYLNSIEGVASETIRNENGDASAFGMHQADAGSDAYDRDFALSLLGKEQDALYEINEALKRIETGTYGLCEGTGTKIPEERLEAMPFARYSVAYQEKIERSQISGRWSRPVHSLFGLDNADDAAADDDKDDDDTAPSSKSGESLDFSK
jgi:RNA polymerase-binding transcription factor DksA